jgi:hypothetical protein
MGYQEVHLIREQMRRGHEVVILASNILGGSGPIITGKRTNIEKRTGLSV